MPGIVYEQGQITWRFVRNIAEMHRWFVEGVSSMAKDFQYHQVIESLIHAMPQSGIHFSARSLLVGKKALGKRDTKRKRQTNSILKTLFLSWRRLFLLQERILNFFRTICRGDQHYSCATTYLQTMVPSQLFMRRNEAKQIFFPWKRFKQRTNAGLPHA